MEDGSKRKSARIRKSIKVKISHEYNDLANSLPINCFSKDLSIGGIQLEINTKYKPGELDLSKYKILSDGEIKGKFIINAKEASKSAIEKVKKEEERLYFLGRKKRRKLLRRKRKKLLRKRFLKKLLKRKVEKSLINKSYGLYGTIFYRICNF